MPDNILVVEYEPKYTDRVRQALTGLPLTVTFARDGEEALREVASSHPALIVLSSVVPKGNAGDIIKAIRGRSLTTPILLTVSGYSGKDPAQDVARFGVSDILPKPYTEADFLAKVQSLLGLPATPQLTSDDIFGDILDDSPAAPAQAPRKNMNPTDNIDKLLADTLGGSMPKRTATSPGTTAKPKSAAELDKILNDSLSGLEKKKPPVKSDPPPSSAAAPERVAAAAPIFVAEHAAPKEEPEPADGVRFGPYVLLEKIATGGMAEVWKARKSGEEGFQKIVAIKKILPHLSDNQEFIEMFIDEAKLAAQLNHNNIIHIYDLGKIGSSYYIAMEYVDGYDLKTIIKRGQEKDHPLGVELSLFIASRLASALDYAHRKRDFNQVEMGLVHRDVSPQNVLISQDGDVKLCDFGIAKAATKASHTQIGALKGKLQYMSPEQASGKPIDRRSDIFAVAAVLFEMLTGRKLFSGDSEMSILEQVREARVTPPSQWNDEVTPEIDAIVAKGLQKDPERRYQTAGDMAKDIEGVLYSLRPTPTSADLAIYMHRLSAPEPVIAQAHVEAPVVVPPGPIAAPPPPAVAAATPVRAATSVTPTGVAMPSWEAPPASVAAAAGTPKRRSAALPIVFVLLLLAGIVGGYFFVRSRPVAQTADAQTNSAATMAPVSPAAAPPLTPAETGTVLPVPTETTNTNPPAPGTVAPTLDPTAVDQEVQRLLAAERARLEQQQAAAAQRAQQPAPAVRQPAPQPQPSPTQTTAPAQEPEPVPTVTEAPAVATVPTETTPAAPQFRQGDLVPQGTEGLTPPRVIRYGSVPYPQMARTQRVQGTILMSVLVSETGQVLEMRLIRGVNRPVGLNEAAEQVIRRSTFSAPMMRDGTRVKAWATVPVKFEL